MNYHSPDGQPQLETQWLKNHASMGPVSPPSFFFAPCFGVWSTPWAFPPLFMVVVGKHFTCLLVVWLNSNRLTAQIQIFGSNFRQPGSGYAWNPIPRGSRQERPRGGAVPGAFAHRRSRTPREMDVRWSLPTGGPMFTKFTGAFLPGPPPIFAPSNFWNSSSP